MKTQKTNKTIGARLDDGRILILAHVRHETLEPRKGSQQRDTQKKEVHGK